MTTNAPTRPADEDDAPEANGFDPRAARRTLRLAWRHKWYGVGALVACTAAASWYAWRAEPVYVATATVQVLKRAPQVMRGVEIVDTGIANDVDFQTQVKVLESMALAQAAAARVPAAEVPRLVEPLRRGRAPAPDAASVIYSRRRIIPQRGTLMTQIQFLHPDPRVTASVANLLATEYIAYNSRLRVEESLKAVDELRDRADQQRQRVNEIANALQAYRQRGNLISLHQSRDIVTERLKALNMMATQSADRLKDAEIRWSQVQVWEKEGRDLAELPFIAAQPQVQQLLSQIPGLKLSVAQLEERYKDRHYKLIAARNLLAEALAELQSALQAAVASVRADYDRARRSDEEARKALAEQEKQSLELDRAAVEFDNLSRDLRVNEQLLESMLGRMREASVSSSIETDSARLIDRAAEPGRPISPNVPAILVLGVAGGSILGCGVSLLRGLATSRLHDEPGLEKLLELPQWGGIPELTAMDATDKAQVAWTGYDPAAARAFGALHDRLRLGATTGGTLLVAATQRGDGASFTAANLALLLAAQGQRTALVDCDLWQPALATTLRLDPGGGVADFCAHGARADEIIRRGVRPNLDVVTAGSRVKDTAGLLAGREFELLLRELARSHDRVVLDGPPLDAPEAAALAALSHGVLIVIRNRQSRRAAAFAALDRLRDQRAHVLGMVLNGVQPGDRPAARSRESSPPPSSRSRWFRATGTG